MTFRPALIISGVISMSDSGSASVAFAMRVIVYQTHSAQSSAYSRMSPRSYSGADEMEHHPEE